MISKVRQELQNYDIFPKVILVGEPAEITIRPLGRHAASEGEYTLGVWPLTRTYRNDNNNTDYTVKVCDDGCIRFTHTFTFESEHFIRLYRDGRKLLQLSVYALDSDMAGRYPLRGDLHIHSFRSDGREAPEVVAANYRSHGYDFMALTDHGRYYPSLEAMDAYADIPTGLCLVPGEEVHLPGNPTHIVNFGGNFSINGLVEGLAQGNESTRRAVIDNPPPVRTEEEYRAEVEALIPSLDLPDDIDPFTYASCVWAFDLIREADGLGIFPHPYWISDVFQIPENFTHYILRKHPFDAFEVLGGERYFQHNGFQTAAYYAARADGVDLPIVGSTDAHTSVSATSSLICSTIVFAHANERKAIISAVKDKYSIAVDTISAEYRIVGDFRLMKYARFLLDNYFDLHDEMCMEEGRLMKLYVTGADEAAGDTLRAIAGRSERFLKKYIKV